MNSFPFPRQTRQTEILVGDGGATYGPFSDIKIFDIEDVVAWVKPDGQGFYEEAAVTVTKTGPDLSEFTVQFGTNLPSTTEFVIQARRVHERSTDVFRGGTLSAKELEKELSKMGQVLQEARRDLNSSIRLPFGFLEPLVEEPQDGRLAIWGVVGDQVSLLNGPNADEIASAQGYAESALEDRERAEAAAEAAELSAIEADVSFSQNDPATRIRTLLNRGRDTVHVTDFDGVEGDDLNDDTDGINAALANCLLTGRGLFWPATGAEYRITGNLENFHDVKHYGPGRIRRGSNVWHITPIGDETNIIYVGAPSLTANDGLTPDQATNVAAAFNRIRNIAEKAQDGRWRIQFLSETLTSTGITIPRLPAFRNRLEVFGADVALTAVPTTVWDGSGSVNNYAIRGDWSNNLGFAFLHFKNIKFINWQNTTLSGGIVIWAAGDVLSENLHFTDCSVGEWYRQCYVRSTHGIIENAQTYGIGIQYGASGNVGNLSGGGKTFINCGDAVSVGRCATVYIQGSGFSACVICISVTRTSRIRTQGNTFTSWTLAVVYAQAVGVWTPDNGQGFPDTYVMTPTDDAPVFRCENGSVHTLIHRFDGNINAYNAQGSVVSIANALGVQTLLATAPGAAAGDFVPARVPAWWLYSPTASLETKMYMVFAANAGGTLALHSQGTAASTKLAEIVIPAVAAGRSGSVEIELFRRKGSNTARYIIKLITSDGAIRFAAGSSASLDISATRSPSENTIQLRLYWTPADNNQVQFADMKSKIEV